MIIVWTTLPDPGQAEALARRLVEERLAACAQIDDSIRSIYRWDEGVEEGREARLMLKTRASCWPRLRQRVEELHPYTVPQIVAAEAEAAPAYCDWLLDSTDP